MRQNSFGLHYVAEAQNPDVLLSAGQLSFQKVPPQKNYVYVSLVEGWMASKKINLLL